MYKQQYFINIYELFSKIQNKYLENSKNEKLLYTPIFSYEGFIEHHYRNFGHDNTNFEALVFRAEILMLVY